MSRTAIAVHILVLLGTAEAFVARRIPSSLSEKGSRTPTKLSSLSNLFSGVTGVAPAQIIDKSTIERLVEGTSLENKELVCSYKASRDGWSAIDFHQAVDGRGSGLVVVLGRSGVVFGGFNPLGWMSTDDYGSSNSAFLWFLKGSKPVICPVLSGGNAAVFDYATGGPCFGAADLQLGAPQAAVMGGFAGPDMEDTRVNAGSLRQGSSSVGGAYNVVAGFPARGKFQVAEVEVYTNADIIPSGSGSSWWPF